MPSLRKTSSKGAAEFAVAVADQEPRLFEQAGDAEVAGLLGAAPTARETHSAEALTSLPEGERNKETVQAA